jgi:CcmD family protein
MPLAPLLQDTPNTASFLYIGYGIVIGLLILYLASLAVRRRNLEKDLDLVETLTAEAKAGAEQK